MSEMIVAISDELPGPAHSLSGGKEVEAFVTLQSLTSCLVLPTTYQ